MKRWEVESPFNEKDEMNPYDLGWRAGYDDEYPECPFPEESDEAKEWWEGYEQGSLDC